MLLLVGYIQSRVTHCYCWWVTAKIEQATLRTHTAGNLRLCLTKWGYRWETKGGVWPQVYRGVKTEADSGRCSSDQMLCRAHRTPPHPAWRADRSPRADKPRHQTTPSDLPCRTAPCSDFLVCTCMQVRLSSLHQRFIKQPYQWFIISHGYVSQTEEMSNILIRHSQNLSYWFLTPY